MQLYYIRHAQSINNANWETEGFIENSDAPLTDIGRQQAQLTADFLAKNQLITEHVGWNSNNRHGFGITHLYTSLMERAVHTAAPIAGKLPGIPFHAWTDLHETGGIYGRAGELKDKGLPGKPRSYFEQSFPELSSPQNSTKPVGGRNVRWRRRMKLTCAPNASGRDSSPSMGIRKGRRRRVSPSSATGRSSSTS